ncbi:hypothetical protein LOZ51_006774 [Ophidiomyces ophidiicola]|nr:hypothetical protein LOZ55_006538 [Ophidiomyces ophidiicola]KAI1974798.1 hypothetical protein LOZ54_006709 [Ophidiomyces ophidiicola]KAI1983950.1 hypothetical protein LOZ51_006774 [Ophidiomyces ophidiicola]
MGRRPNAIVSEFFNRGNKLPDSSNRYEHTCKLCGESFPKGRPDSLLTHLMKNCQAISFADKQRVLHLSRVSIGAGSRQLSTNGQSDIVPRNISLDTTRTASFNSVGGLNGLNVLAEASRRVGATDETGDAQENTHGDKTIVVDPTLEHSGNIIIDFEDQFTASPNQTPQLLPVHVKLAPSARFTGPGLSLGTDTLADIRHPSQLSLIAASANEIVSESTAETFISDHNIIAFSSEPLDNANRAIYPRPIGLRISPPISTESSNHATVNRTKHKSRSAFSEERRKQVQLVRKMGACLRCRMLKKTCSAGTPCSQCKNLQNPRVWMECCFRTRLMTRLEAYSVGLHSTVAYHDINNIRSQVHFEHSGGRIEVTHFEGDPSFVLTFNTLYARKQTVAELGSQLSISSNNSEPGAQSQDVHILDGEVEELTGKLEAYIKRVTDQFFKAESSEIIKQTLIMASDLCKASQDDLLEGVLELWATTSVLVGPLLPWKIFLNPTLPPTAIQPLSSSSSEWRIPIRKEDGPESYSLICSQLCGAVEKRAAKISRAVLNKIEQRLLQRQREGNFRTFLASLILLNCVERMSWLFHTWQGGILARRWPLERSPADFAAQGDRFSNIIATHLKMRSLAPAFLIEPGTGVLIGSDVNEDTASRWFDTVRISQSYLLARQAASLDISDWRSLDFKYCSSLILSTENARFPV